MKSVEQNILVLRQARWSCSQATIVGIFRGLGIDNPSEELLKAAVATLRGGIGRTFDQGSCGALTAGAVALGLLFHDDEERATRLTTALYKSFKSNFGSAMCGSITTENGKKRCTECCLYVGRQIENLSKD